MKLNQLIEQLEFKRDRRSYCINDQHINQIYRRLTEVEQFTDALRSQIMSLQQRCHRLQFTGSHEHILDYWKTSLDCYFSRVYHYARKSNNLSDESANDIEERVREIESDLFSENLTRIREDDDYNILDLSIKCMKEIRDILLTLSTNES